MRFCSGCQYHNRWFLLTNAESFSLFCLALSPYSQTVSSNVLHRTKGSGNSNNWPPIKEPPEVVSLTLCLELINVVIFLFWGQSDSNFLTLNLTAEEWENNWEGGLKRGFWMESMMSYEGAEKRDERARTTEGLVSDVLRDEIGEFTREKANQQSPEWVLKDCFKVCVYVCVHHSPFKESPAFPWRNSSLCSPPKWPLSQPSSHMLGNSQMSPQHPCCFLSFPACWRPSCPRTHYLNTPAIHRLCMVKTLAYLCVCKSLYAGVKHQILLLFLCLRRRFRAQLGRLCSHACLCLFL